MSHGGVKAAKNGKGGQSPDSSREGSEMPAPPPDGGWGWMVVFASFMIHVFTDGMTYSFGVFYDEFLDYFEEGNGKTAWILSILVGVTLSSGPISSSFVNRWGCRSVTVAGGLLSAICITLSGLAQNVLTLIFTIGVCTGFGFGLIYLPAIVSVTVWFEKYRSLATGIAVCGSGFGTLLFAPITNNLIREFGWRGAMIIIGAITLNCIPLGVMFRPVPDAPRSPAAEPMLPKTKNAPLKRSQSTENVVSNGKADETDIARLTLSQPALNKHEHHHHKTHTRSGSGIMLRPDVLYQGSMQSLSRSRAPSPDRHVHHAMIKHDIEEDSRCGWLPCAAESKAALSQMLDLSLLVDPIFLLFSLSNFLTSIGFYIPYLYVVPMTKGMGIENPEYLVSIIGISNMVGRIFLGYFSDKPYVNRLLAYNVCLAISGISTAFAAYCTDFWSLAVYATVFGFSIGAYVGLTSVVLVDLLGLEKLTNAFGLLLLFQGIASLIGPPLAGFLYDHLGSYGPSFILAGGAMALSGLILFFIPMLERRRNNWNQDMTLDQI